MNNKDVSLRKRKLTTSLRNVPGSANKAIRQRRKKASVVSKGEKAENSSLSYATRTRSNQVLKEYNK